MIEFPNIPEIIKTDKYGDVKVDLDLISHKIFSDKIIHNTLKTFAFTKLRQSTPPKWFPKSILIIIKNYIRFLYLRNS